MVCGYNRIKMKKYDKEKTYQVTRMRLQGYSMSVPEMTGDGGYSCRKISYERIEYGGKTYRCAKDHKNRVIYIDTHAMEEPNEGSG